MLDNRRQNPWTAEQVTTYGRIIQEQVQKVEKTPRNYKGNIFIDIHDIYNLMVLGYIAHIWQKCVNEYSDSDSLNTSLAAAGALTHRLQRRTACKTQNGHGVWKGV